ncbi:glycosyltransferase [Candidatus Saccharibacteria bacterium]|nr:glycosyltransferase [Candidatus Saccharibacteria bacterium]
MTVRLSRETIREMNKRQSPVRVAFVVPHIFMGDELRDKVIFSPGELAREFANASFDDVELTLFSPLPVKCRAKSVTADRSGFERELAGRGYGYLTLLKKHPSLFVAMSRQLQGEVIAEAFRRANAGEFDVVHIYTNEEDQALIFADLCCVPVVFTHHDPYNFLIKYKSVFPRYKHHKFVSMSIAQQRTAPRGTNFVANIYHGVSCKSVPTSAPNRACSPLSPQETSPCSASAETDSQDSYMIYVGRIIEPKGVHLAVVAAKKAGVRLVIAGKRYGDDYFERRLKPHLSDNIEYVGFKRGEELQELIANAKALVMPSQFEEPFGMTAIEALAVGTPVIASRSGALPEIIEDGVSGLFADTAGEIVLAMNEVDQLQREDCVKRVREHFSLRRMLDEHARLWRELAR